MKSIKLAVFGHYDSRGGTTGMPLPDQPTVADLKEAFDKYNNDCFSWGDTIKEYKADPSGWNWNPTEPWSSPADNDFMFVAELWYEDEVPDGDLEGTGVVLIDPDTETAFDAEVMRREGIDQMVAFHTTLASPTQLEFIPLGMGRYQSEHEYTEAKEAEGGRSASWEEWLVSKVQALDRNHDIENRNWNDDAYGFMIGTGL